MVRLVHFALDCAPLERETLVVLEIYKHPAPLESKQCLLDVTTTRKESRMSTITTKDGTQIYYKDWGDGQPLFFHHGWPLSADDGDAQMMFFFERGYRVIAHDRRGHGRSTQTVTGNEMDTYAADVNELVEKLDLREVIHIGHSTGGGEVARYVARYGKGKVAQAVLISAVPPITVKSDQNPGGTPLEVFDQIREST